MGYDIYQLAIPYFKDICLKVFNDYLYSKGYVKKIVDDKTYYVTFINGDKCIRFSYYLEDSPNFSPLVSVGFVEEENDLLKFDVVSLWYFIPNNKKIKKYGEWTFLKAHDLEQIFIKIRDTIVDVYVLQLIKDPIKIRNLINLQQKEIMLNYNQEVHSQKLIKAHDAFIVKKYKNAIEIYSGIGLNNLTPIEKKRLEIAKKLMDNESWFMGPIK